MNANSKEMKNRFLRAIRKYEETGIVRFVIGLDYLCLISVGEIVYVLCPYLADDEARPYGVRLSPVNIIKVFKDPTFGMRLINCALTEHERYGSLLAFFSDDKIESWKKWVDDHKATESFVNPEFEKELIRKYVK